MFFLILIVETALEQQLANQVFQYSLSLLISSLQKRYIKEAYNIANKLNPQHFQIPFVTVNSDPYDLQAIQLSQINHFRIN